MEHGTVTPSQEVDDFEYSGVAVIDVWPQDDSASLQGCNARLVIARTVAACEDTFHLLIAFHCGLRPVKVVLTSQESQANASAVLYVCSLFRLCNTMRANWSATGPRRSVLEADPVLRTKRLMLLATLSAGSPYERKSCRGRQFDGNERSSRTRRQWRRPSICARLGGSRLCSLRPSTSTFRVRACVPGRSPSRRRRMTQKQTQEQHECSIREHTRTGLPAKSRAGNSVGEPQYLTGAATGGLVQMQISPRRPQPSERRSFLSQCIARTISLRESLFSPVASGRRLGLLYSPAFALFADPLGPSASVLRIQRSERRPRRTPGAACCEPVATTPQRACRRRAMPELKYASAWPASPISCTPSRAARGA